MSQLLSRGFLQLSSGKGPGPLVVQDKVSPPVLKQGRVEEDLDKFMNLTCRQPLAADAHQGLQQHQQGPQLLNLMPCMRGAANRGAACGCVAAWLITAVRLLLLLQLVVMLLLGLWLLLGGLTAGEGRNQQQDVQQLLQNLW